MFDPKKNIAQFDPELFLAMRAELKRQEECVELIASENYVSQAVLEAQGSVLTNKYAEGYPTKRYYGGCEFVDQVEQLAIDRCQALFGADYVNVQPHSGSQANQAVFMAALKPGDVILGMSLAHGGHLTHGAAANVSGRLYQAFSYGLNEQEEIDYEAVEHLAKTYQPKMIIAGASAYSLEIDWARFRHIADQVGAYLFVDMAHYAGLVAAGEYPSPISYADFVTTTTHKTLRGPRGGIVMAKAQYAAAINSAVFPCLQGGPLMHVIAAKAIAFKEALEPCFKDYAKQIKKNAQVMAEVLTKRGLRVVSGRTESHVLLIDLRSKNTTGKAIEKALEVAHITVNKNAIPNDPEKFTITSGIRIGTPAITTRGFKEAEARLLANLLADVTDSPDNIEILSKVRQVVVALCQHFPVYDSA